MIVAPNQRQTILGSSQIVLPLAALGHLFFISHSLLISSVMKPNTPLISCVCPSSIAQACLLPASIHMSQQSYEWVFSLIWRWINTLGRWDVSFKGSSYKAPRHYLCLRVQYAAGPGDVRRRDLSLYSFPLSHLWNLTAKKLNPSDLKENSWQHNRVSKCASL